MDCLAGVSKACARPVPSATRRDQREHAQKQRHGALHELGEHEQAANVHSVDDQPAVRGEQQDGQGLNRNNEA